MAVTVAVKKRVKPGNTLVALCQLTLSGSYPTGGDSCDLSKTGFTNRKPDMAIIQGIAGYIYQWDRANNLLFVRGGAAASVALTEFTSGAYSAALTGDTILARLEWMAVPQLP
jgi:hypothetical protein